MKAKVLTAQVNYQLAAVLLAVLLSLTFVFRAYSQSSDEQLALNENATYSAAIEAYENDLQLNTNTSEAEENFGRTVVFNRFETDNELDIELWMYCDYYWTGVPCEALLNPSVIEEEPLKVEEWMHDNHYWSGK